MINFKKIDEIEGSFNVSYKNEVIEGQMLDSSGRSWPI